MANTIVLRGGLDGTRNVEGKVISAFSPGHMTMRTSSGGFQKHNSAGGKSDFFFAKENYTKADPITTAYVVNEWSLNHRPNRGDIINARIAAGVSLTARDKIMSAGDGTVKKAVTTDNLYQNTAASATITNTTTETAFDKTFPVPAGTLRAGDQIRIRAKVVTPTTNSTDTLVLKVKIGSTVLVATSAVDVANDDIGIIEVVITFRTVGASGTMIADAKWALGAADTATFRVDSLASTSVDTTAALSITVTATWSVASASNIARLDTLGIDMQRDTDDYVIGECEVSVDNSAGSDEAFCPILIL